MKKYVLIIISFVLVAINVHAQIRITEVLPISNNGSKFFELFYNNKTNNGPLIYDYYILVYTRKANANPKMFVGKLDFKNPNLFSLNSNISNPSPNYTLGTLVCAENPGENKFNGLSEVNGQKISWTNLFGTTGTMYEYVNSTWSATATETVNPLPDYVTNDKLAVMVFRKDVVNSRNILVDVVADIYGTGQELVLYNDIEHKNSPSSATEIFNLSKLVIGPEKYVNESLGNNNPYQLKRDKKADDPYCTVKWDKISVETPGYVDGVSVNIPTWAVSYYLPKIKSWELIKQSDKSQLISLLQSLDFSGAIPGVGPHIVKKGDKNYLKLIVQVSNLTQFKEFDLNTYKKFVFSVYIDQNGDNKLWEINQNTKQLVYTDVPLFDSMGNRLGDYLQSSTSTTGLLLEKYEPSVYIDDPIWFYNDGKPSNLDPFLVELKIELPGDFAAKTLYILTGYENSEADMDYCYGTLKGFKMPSALPAQFKTSAVKIVDGKARYSWTTSSEQNNKGFEVQRSVGNTNDFKTIGFVGTRAKDGNSQTEINYNFDDADLKAGVVHYYRLNQIDFDGKAMLTPIKSIKPGSIETDLSVYPNPNQGSFLVNASKLSGKVSIFLIDNTGRVINHFNNVAESTTRISNLKTGFYTLKIVNTETGEQSAQRIVVQ